MVNAANDGIFQSVRKGAVSGIMQKNSYQSGFFLLSGYQNTFASQRGNCHIHQMQCSKGMLKPAVSGSGIDKTCQAQLFDIPQSLKPGMLNQVKYKIPGDAYETINRVINYFSLISQIDHLGNFRLQNYELTPFNRMGCKY
jgi:hypothetical protein